MMNGLLNAQGQPKRKVHSPPGQQRQLLVWFVALCASLHVAAIAQPFVGSDLPIPVAAGGMAQWADYDGDGDYDFVITGQPGLRVYRNDGGGVFTPQGLALQLRQSYAAIWGDWDNDNDLDLVVGGADTGGVPVQNVYSVTRLYRNDGTNGFTLVGEGIPFIGFPSLVDMDNDGDLDLVIVGDRPNIGSGDSLTLRAIRVYSNEGDGSFKLQTELTMPVSTFSARAADLNADGWTDLQHLQVLDNIIVTSARLNLGSQQFNSNSVVRFPLGPGLPLFGDMDNDGDEDLGIFSYDNGPSPNYPGWLRNDGPTNTLLPGIAFPLGNVVCTLVDYDNDGQLDIATTGVSSALGNVFRLFHNDGSFAFSQVNPGITGIQFAVMAWGDSDQDGDLDLLLSGIPNPPTPGNPFIRLYRNDTPNPNPPPGPPPNLSTLVTGSGVLLSWGAAVDSNQTGGLTYNLRVGRSPGAGDVVTPMAEPGTGRLLLPQPGNAGLRRFSLLTNLLAGQYYWSVQAVDCVYASSPFVEPGSFIIPPGLPRVSEAGASDVRYRHATLTASAIANGASTLAWFEYGLSTNYDNTTPATVIGDGTAPISFTNEIIGLLTATNYHFRAVASNSVGRAVSPDAVFFISNTLPVITGLTNLVVLAPNQSSPLLGFTIGDLETPAASLVVTATVQNATLLPLTGIEFGGTGSNRTVRLTPAPEQRGTTSVTVRVSDEHGGQKSQSLTLRVEDFVLLWGPLSGSGDVALADINGDGFLDVVRNGRWLRNQSGTNLILTDMILNPLSGSMSLADFDNDGDLDVSQTGVSGSGARLTSLWTNEPPTGGLSRIRAAGVTNLQGFAAAAISWADFDQDGDADLFLAGNTNAPLSVSNYKTRAYRNDGTLGFTLVPGLFPDMSGAAFGWADFDRDGDLDVCITGNTNLQTAGYLTGLYRNDGTGQFTPLATSLPPITGGFVAWGDVDNDGWPDLLLAGTTRIGSVTTNIARLFRNGGDGTFSEYAAFEGLSSPRGLLLDVDNDGRLDFLHVGTPAGGFQPAAKVYLNQGGGAFLNIWPASAPSFSPVSIVGGDLDRDGKVEIVLGVLIYRSNFPMTNLPPEVPGGLEATPLADTVLLSWQEATDANQSGGLTYNLRVGTAPGAVNICSPAADPVTGCRWAVGPGNASQSRQWRLRHLAPGTYYWSVQAIDHAGGESPFAPEQTFAITDPRPRILSLSLTNGSATLEVQFGGPGNYSLLASPDLHSWSEVLPAADYLTGETSLLIPTLSESGQYFRLRRN